MPEEPTPSGREGAPTLVVLALARTEAEAGPLGLRHAARSGDGPRVLCGALVGGWRVFDEVAFDGKHPAACRRCVLAARR